MKINKNKNKNKLNGGEIDSYLIKFLIFCIVIIFCIILYNIYIKNNKNTCSNTDSNMDSILKPLSEFLKNIAISNRIKDVNVLKNINNKIKINNVVGFDKFLIDDYIYIRLPLNNFE